MQLIKLQGKGRDGQLIQLIFNAEKGMNLMSFKWGPFQLIDQTTMVLFNQRAAGLGALIGPHFHHRPSNLIVPIEDETLFPHLSLNKEKNIAEPFSHGIARYVPWTITEQSENSVKAHLSSKNLWKNITLSSLEGQEFEMNFLATIKDGTLLIDYSITSQNPSVVGMHYYYAIDPKGKNTIRAKVKDQMNDQGVLRPSKNIVGYDQEEHLLEFDLVNGIDMGFKPHPHEFMGLIDLITPSYDLHFSYTSAIRQNSWQLYHPKGASYVCIEPLSATDPRKPQEKISGISLALNLTQKI